MCRESQAWVSSCERVLYVYRVLPIDLNLVRRFHEAWSRRAMKPRRDACQQLSHPLSIHTWDVC